MSLLCLEEVGLFWFVDGGDACGVEYPFFEDVEVAGVEVSFDVEPLSDFDVVAPLWVVYGDACGECVDGAADDAETY